MHKHSCHILTVAIFLLLGRSVGAQEIIGVTATPHQFSTEMRWRRPPEPTLSAQCTLFVLNSSEAPLPLTAERIQYDGKTPEQLLSDAEWAWHDTPASWQTESESLEPNQLTVLTFNGRSKAWSVETDHELQLSESRKLKFRVPQPRAWMSAVTFLSVDDKQHLSNTIQPKQIEIHVVNQGHPIQLKALRVWLPADNSHHRFELAQTYNKLEMFPADGALDSNAKGGLVISCDRLPLGYCVLQLQVQDAEGANVESLWAHLRIKREVFDISGGWVASDVGGRNSLTIDEYRRTLKRMHINTGQIQDVGGFTDRPDEYAKLPLKRFNRMWPLERYDTDEMLPQIHAVEFLGEPQYGGGRPVPPQEVWEKLAPYQSSRLATSLTLSEERTWRYYAGLSDYPHYDAYRVIAPAADSWRSYDRWGGQQIRWGAPLETIGSMTRSLREQSRPRPIAYWSQGAHHGWGGFFSPRRGSPNAQELRSQAWHGLANRITSLYWFNLSLKSLAKFPDLIEPITRVNREILMLQRLFLEGDAFEYRRLTSEGTAAWDLNSIATAESVLLVAHDLRYQIDPKASEFRFEKRDADLRFKRPAWLAAEPLEVFRVDADGVHAVKHKLAEQQIHIQDEIEVVGLYVATSDGGLRKRLQAECKRLKQLEASTGFDPGSNSDDAEKLKSFLR